MHADTLDAVDAWQDISDAKALASSSLHVIIIYRNQLFHVSSNVYVILTLVLVLQYDYGSMLTSSHQFYRSQWVGELPADYDIPWRSSAFTTDVGPTTLDWGDMSGGIMEGREAGNVVAYEAMHTALLCFLHIVAVFCASASGGLVCEDDLGQGD